MNLPVNDWGATGQLVQVAYTSVWQEAMLRRNVHRNPLPCVLWMDEASNFTHKGTSKFAKESRSKLSASVLLNQNKASYTAAGMRPEDVETLLGNLTTKLFLRQNCAITNAYAAETVSKALVNRINFHTPSGGYDEQHQGNVGAGQTMDYEEGVTPRDFLTMMNGGPLNHYLVEALVVGKEFSTGKPYIRTAIQQMQL